SGLRQDRVTLTIRLAILHLYSDRGFLAETRVPERVLPRTRVAFQQTVAPVILAFHADEDLVAGRQYKLRWEAVDHSKKDPEDQASFHRRASSSDIFSSSPFDASPGRRSPAQFPSAQWL